MTRADCSTDRGIHACQLWAPLLPCPPWLRWLGVSCLDKNLRRGVGPWAFGIDQ